MCPEEHACVLDGACAADSVKMAQAGSACTILMCVIRLGGPLLPIIVDDLQRRSSHHPLGFGHNYC